jgi:shikimate kinase
VTAGSHPEQAPSAGLRRIILTGFMGSGKSTVGPLVAERLGWRFIDVDEVIEAEAGCKISELFAGDGEEAFRDLEQATVERLWAGEDLVLALGGGAIERGETRDLLLSSPGTLMVHLEIELATTLARCGGSEQIRPILADRANLAGRYARRLPLYRTAHVSIRVDRLSPSEAAEEIVRLVDRSRSGQPQGHRHGRLPGTPSERV